MFTSEQLLQIMPKIPKKKLPSYTEQLNLAMELAHMDTPLRAAAFIAQLAHESGELRWFEEFADGSAYEGRKDLGNVFPGDGVKYKGRGPIQLTGRNNYKAAGDALGVDLVAKPELAATAEYGFKIATWFWNSRNLNTLADAQDLKGVTKKINGGYNGLAQREKYYIKALACFGIAYVPK
jgi:putative chitinase